MRIFRPDFMNVLFVSILIVWSSTILGDENNLSGNSVSVYAGNIFLSLLIDATTFPNGNAVEKLGEGAGWNKLTPEQAALQNAKVGYVGEKNGMILGIASDGTNDIFSVAISGNFHPLEFLSALDGAVDYTLKSKDRSMGQFMEIYELYEKSKSIGLMIITYGAIDAIKGVGSVSYMSKSKAKKSGIW
jgi:hypothetical protein